MKIRENTANSEINQFFSFSKLDFLMNLIAFLKGFIKELLEKN